MSQSNNRPYPQGQRIPQGSRGPQRPASRPGQYSADGAGRPPVRQGGNPQARRPAASDPRRSAPPRRRSGGRIPDLGKLLVGGLVAVVLAYMLQCMWPDGFPLKTKQDSGSTAVQAVSEIHSGGPIRINEVMSGNQNVLSIEDGSTPDWIEIANIGKSSVNLSGYSLSKTANSVTVFTFPEVWVNPGECVLVYADSRLRETAGEDLHAPFRLSSAGDTLMLFNDGGTASYTVNLPALARNASFARVDTSTWQVSNQPTPGMLNTEENYRALNEPANDSPVIMTELMSGNATTLADENGLYYDYIELYNRSGEAVNLSGWYLSDNPASTRMWRFPDVTLNPGEYLVVFASGLDRKEDVTHLHTNFSLSTEGEQVVLSNAQGRQMDSVTFDLLRKDVAWSRADDGSWTDAKQPSPGRANP